MVLERFWWGPSLDVLRDSRNGALWLEHCEVKDFEVFSPDVKVLRSPGMCRFE